MYTATFGMHHRAAVRLFGLWLLILATSPVTAPFSTLDLSDLFGVTRGHAGAILQSKTTIDESTAEVASPGFRVASLQALAIVAAGPTPAPRSRTILAIPLRI